MDPGFSPNRNSKVYIRSDEELTFEKSALKTLHVGQFTLSWLYTPPTQHHSFFFLKETNPHPYGIGMLPQ